MTTGATWVRWHNSPIETQDTQPLPLILPLDRRPTLKELRLRCGLSREQLARASGVRLCRVYWMEYGVETPLRDAVAVLRILSQVAHRQFYVADVHNLRVRIEPKTYMDRDMEPTKRGVANERSKQR